LLNVSSSFKDAVYAPIRQINSRIHFTFNGETKIYDDTYIISVNLLEEMNTINDTLPSNEITVRLDNTSGEFNFLTLQNMQEIIASRPKIKLEFGIVFENNPFLTFYQLDDTENIEWVPMGTYYLSEWKSETASMSIRLICHDNFDMLGEVSYDNTATDTLHNLAVDILTKAGITDYEIDSSLQNLSGAFSERLDSRTALQHIGIAARAAVYQDRYGKFVIKPFIALDASSNYLTYAGQANLYAGSSSYPLVTDGEGMKHIDYDNMYEEPEISLDKSIYEVVVKVYDSTEPREVVYVNTSINGKNGQSFSIDNPLIMTEELASKVAQWIIRESNYNAIYKVIWRQNPILECADIVLVEDSFEANKQTRIYKQEFQYEGYLNGVTESRGGI
jgi:hypothetical protein